MAHLFLGFDLDSPLVVNFLNEKNDNRLESLETCTVMQTYNIPDARCIVGSIKQDTEEVFDCIGKHKVHDRMGIGAENVGAICK